MRVKRFLIAAGFAVLSFNPASAQSAPAAYKKLVLEDYFQGRFAAEGVFSNKRDGSQRRVKVAMRGTWDGKVLTLSEDFRFSDGARDFKTWRFTKTAPGRYTGRREDVVGEARVYEEDGGIRLKYDAVLAGYTVAFSDVLTQTGPRTVLNTADVSLFVIPVGDVVLRIRKTGR